MFGTFMIAPCGATGKTKQGYFLSRGKVVTAHSGTLRVVPSPKECASCSKTPYQGVRQYALKQERDETNGDGVKPGSTSPMGHGGANVQLGRTRPSLNIFTPSPFVSEFYAQSCNARAEGVAGSSMRIECTSRGEYCSPSFPSGFPPPLGTGDNPPKMRDTLFVLFDKVRVSHRDNRAANSTH